jgi:predicted AAA+ superfamily ATPase
VERVRRLFAYLAQNSGAVFNAAKVAEWFRAGGEDKTDPRSVREWLRILEETCLVVLVGSEARGARARLGERPRVYMADHGLVLAFAPIPDPLHDPDLGGRIHEAVVLRHLRTIPEVRVGYCRPGDDLEADFAVSWPGRAGTDTVLVEVTASRSPRPEKVARLARLAEEHRIARAALIYGGVEPRAWGSVTLVPLHEVLLDPRAALGGGGEATP